jgi:hypothetical protein
MDQEIRVDFLGDASTDPAELDSLTRELSAEILQVGEVDRVDQVSAGPAPPGSKGLDVAAIGSLVVAIAPGLQAAGKVIEVVRSWLSRRPGSAPPLQMTIGDRSITVVADKEQQDALVAAFIEALTSKETRAAGTPTE